MGSKSTAADYKAANEEYRLAFLGAKAAKESADQEALQEAFAMVEEQAAAKNAGAPHEQAAKDAAAAGEVGPEPLSDSQVAQHGENLSDDILKKGTARWRRSAALWNSFTSQLDGTPKVIAQNTGIPTWVWWVLGLGVVGGVAAYAVARSGKDVE